MMDQEINGKKGTEGRIDKLEKKKIASLLKWRQNVILQRLLRKRTNPSEEDEENQGKAPGKLNENKLNRKRTLGRNEEGDSKNKPKRRTTGDRRKALGRK